MNNKTLYRSTTNRKFGGVCGGLGEYFGIDPTLIRILFVLFGFTTAGIIAYIVGMCVMPEATM